MFFIWELAKKSVSGIEIHTTVWEGFINPWRRRVKMRSFQNLPASFCCTNVRVAHSALAHKLSRAPYDMMQGSKGIYWLGINFGYHKWEKGESIISWPSPFPISFQLVVALFPWHTRPFLLIIPHQYGTSYHFKHDVWDGIKFPEEGAKGAQGAEHGIIGMVAGGEGNWFSHPWRSSFHGHGDKEGVCSEKGGNIDIFHGGYSLRQEGRWCSHFSDKWHR